MPTTKRNEEAGNDSEPGPSKETENPTKDSQVDQEAPPRATRVSKRKQPAEENPDDAPGPSKKKTKASTKAAANPNPGTSVNTTNARSTRSSRKRSHTPEPEAEEAEPEEDGSSKNATTSKRAKKGKK